MPTAKEATDEISKVLNKFCKLGYEFHPREGMIVVLYWTSTYKLRTMGAFIEGDMDNPEGWRYVPKSEVPALNNNI